MPRTRAPHRSLDHSFPQQGLMSCTASRRLAARTAEPDQVERGQRAAWKLLEVAPDFQAAEVDGGETSLLQHLRYRRLGGSVIAANKKHPIPVADVRIRCQHGSQ